MFFREDPAQSSIYFSGDGESGPHGDRQWDVNGQIRQAVSDTGDSQYGGGSPPRWRGAGPKKDRMASLEGGPRNVQSPRALDKNGLKSVHNHRIKDKQVESKAGVLSDNMTLLGHQMGRSPHGDISEPGVTYNWSSQLQQTVSDSAAAAYEDWGIYKEPLDKRTTRLSSAEDQV